MKVRREELNFPKYPSHFQYVMDQLSKSLFNSFIPHLNSSSFQTPAIP